MIIALSMQKGGVGKTTTAIALGHLLALSGARVLVVDLDPQSNATQGLGVDPTQIEASIYEVLLNPEMKPHFAIVRTEYGVDLLPATLALAGAEQTFVNRWLRESLLRTALAPLRASYDYILIDSPPSLGLFTINALVAADVVLVPLQAHVFALQALDQLESTVALAQQLNPRLCIGGIVLTMLAHTKVSELVEAAARRRYGDLVFTSTIPHTTKIVEAPAAGQPITVYASESAGAQAYQRLSEEVRARWPISD